MVGRPKSFRYRNFVILDSLKKAKDLSYEEKTKNSRMMFERAKKCLPGGVTYAIRYFEPYPFYVVKAKGSRLWDIDGNEYTDYWTGHGAILMGHSYAPVIEAAKDQLDYGAHFGFSHEWEVKWAEQICRIIPSAEMVRPTNSGTEANMYNIRLARAYTGRSKIGKFEGHWHGGYDGLHKAVSYPFDKPPSLGLTEGASDDAVILPFNNLDGVRERIKGENLACIILEPIMGACGFITPENDFLKGLRELCDEKSILLIFDEVITGFRLQGGAQKFYSVKPDLTTLGKIVGGGYFPAGALCGRADVMEKIDHIKYPNFYERSFHGGTYAGNPLVARAGYTLLKELERREGEIYPYLGKLGKRVRDGLADIFERREVQAYVAGEESMFAIHFTKERPRDGLTAERTKDINLTKALFTFMLNHNIVYLSPTTAHCFISVSHSKEDIDRFLSLTEEFVSKGLKAKNSPTDNFSVGKRGD
jgi:glutamate-1-semialdehyde 2,1-aminomutase